MTPETQHEQAIEDVLHALRTTEPPQGYEARIHNALLQAQQDPHRSITFNSRLHERKSKYLLTSSLPYMSWAAAIVVVLALGVAVQSHLHSTPAQQSSTREVSQRNAISTVPDVSPTPMTPVPALTKRASLPVSKRTQDREEIAQAQRIEVSIQAHEYIPEPPMPLTQQERLVIRMMRRNTAQQLAGYTPDARARQLHEDAQAYHDYFAATPLDGQPIYVQPIEHPQISGAD